MWEKQHAGFPLRLREAAAPLKMETEEDEV